MNRGILNIKDDKVPQQLLLFIFLPKHSDTYIHLLFTCPTLSLFSFTPLAASVILLCSFYRVFLSVCFCVSLLYNFVLTSKQQQQQQQRLTLQSTLVTRGGDCICMILLHMLHPFMCFQGYIFFFFSKSYKKGKTQQSFRCI